MLSKHLTNVIQNLEKKKFREKYNLYKVEGDKLVQELLLSDMKIDSLIARPSWIESNQHDRGKRDRDGTHLQFQISAGSHCTS